MNRLLLLLGMLCASIVQSQDLNVGNSFSTAIINQTQHGVNAPYLFNHILDENYQFKEGARDELYDMNLDLVRFPGGALGNYYRFDNRGYGLLTSEISSIVTPFNCSGSFWCLTRDEDATRNYIYELVDMADHKFTTTGKKTDVMYVLSILLHWAFNEEEIEELEQINNISELATANTAGLISDDFEMRILENYNAVDLLYNNPNIDVVGLEFGNEIYFHQEVTTFLISLNSNPFFNFSQSYNQIQPNITKLITLLNFYRRIFSNIDPNVKIGMPVGNINHLGSGTNINEVWNASIRDRVLEHVDALIPHLYIKSNSFDLNPNNVAGDDDDSQLMDIKETAANFIDIKFDQTIKQYESYFNLGSNNKKLWLTEWNTNKASGNATVWDEWGNSLYQGMFLSKMLEKISTSSSTANRIEYSFIHSWTGFDFGYHHNLISIMDDESVLERVGYYSNWATDFLKSTEVRKLNGSLVNSQNSDEFYLDAFYHYNQVETDDCADQKLTIAFSNLRGDSIPTTFNFTNNIITIDNKVYTITDGELKYFQGNNLASSCGQTDFNANETPYDVQDFVVPVNHLQVAILPPYASGIFEFTIEPAVNTCLPLGVGPKNNELVQLELAPNPATDRLIVTLPKGMDYTDHVFYIVNTLGKVVTSFKMNTGNEINLSVSNLSKGVYFITNDLKDQKSFIGNFVKQ